MSPSPPPPHPTELLSAQSPSALRHAVARAAELLRAGEPVVLPTETVYGLAAHALDPDAVRRIFTIKARPTHNPVIVHVADIPMARACVRSWPDAADRLARAFWPGPLTLVLPRDARIPDIVTGGGDTVGLRWPAHPLMQQVIAACGFPLAAPSANRANEVSPTTADHAMSSLRGRVALIVDGGPCQIGIESTVVDLTTSPPRILRPGILHEASLSAVAGPVAGPEPGGPALPRSPGLLPRHYAPKARLLVAAWRDDLELEARLAPLGGPRHSIHILAHHHIPSAGPWGRVCVIPHDPEAYARAMYAEWHRCDELGAAWIVVEAVPSTPEWQGIADRLRRASTPASATD